MKRKAPDDVVLHVEDTVRWRRLPAALRRRIVTGALLVALVPLVLCRPAGAERPRDPASVQACAEFAQTYHDAKDGVLTKQEFREGLKHVYTLAARSTSPDIQEAAREALRAATRQSDQEVTLWAARLDAACEP